MGSQSSVISFLQKHKEINAGDQFIYSVSQQAFSMEMNIKTEHSGTPKKKSI
jgi:hypothetical protein